MSLLFKSQMLDAVLVAELPLPSRTPQIHPPPGQIATGRRAAPVWVCAPMHPHSPRAMRSRLPPTPAADLELLISEGKNCQTNAQDYKSIILLILMQMTNGNINSF